MTIIAMTLATAPMALPTALVSRPTDPSSCAPRLADWPLGTSPNEAAKASRRWNCSVTTSRNASNWAAMVVPAYQATQPRNPNPRRMTSSSRQPRGIGKTRPISRTPPSRNTAKIAPPTISSSG